MKKINNIHGVNIEQLVIRELNKKDIEKIIPLRISLQKFDFN